MLKKSKYILIFFISFFIVAYGFIVVSNVMPDFIKDRSSFKVNYTKNPFSLQIDTGKYLFYINDKTIDNYKQYVNNFKNINPFTKLQK